MLFRSGRTILVVAAAATMVAACGGGSSGTPSASASPTASGAFTGPEFSTVVPGSWSDETQNQSVVAAVSASGTVLMLLIAPPTQANVMNEHIDVSTSPSPVPDDQLAGYLQSVSQKGATHLSQAQAFSLNGSSGLYITYDYAPPGGVAHRIQDMVINRKGTTYELVLNTASVDFAGQLPALQQVLSAWKWTS